MMVGSAPTTTTTTFFTLSSSSIRSIIVVDEGTARMMVVVDHARPRIPSLMIDDDGMHGGLMSVPLVIYH